MPYKENNLEENKNKAGTLLYGVEKRVYQQIVTAVTAAMFTTSH